MKTKKTKWIQKLKTKPLENSHTSVNNKGSTVRGTWKVNSHFTSALSTVSNTDRLNAFNPPTVIWIEPTPVFPTSPGQQRLILPVHSSWLQQAAKPQQSAGNAGSFAEDNEELTLAWHPLSLLSLSKTYTEKETAGSYFFPIKRTGSFIACLDDRRAIRLLSVLLQTAVQSMAISAHAVLLKHTGYCA